VRGEPNAHDGKESAREKIDALSCFELMRTRNARSHLAHRERQHVGLVNPIDEKDDREDALA